MILLFVLCSLFLIFILTLTIYALFLYKKTNAATHIVNEEHSVIGLSSITREDTTKTVEESLNGTNNTLKCINVKNIDIYKLYNSLN